MYIDGGASADILYEHCFQRLRHEVKSQLNPATTSLTGFTGEKIWPMGQLRLPIMVGNKEHSTTAWMHFMVIRSLETDIQEKDDKASKNRQNRVRNGKDKVKSQLSEENTT
ncbi:hypothetical protein Tco_1306965 [Tanacetum coccineum]